MEDEKCVFCGAMNIREYDEQLEEDLDRIGYFNCLEQNIKGDSFRCENHCGKCVK